MFLSCFILFALIDQGGQLSFFLQGVNIPLLTIVILSFLLEDTPYSVQQGKCNIKDFNTSPCMWLTSSTKGLLPLTNLIGSNYELQEDYQGYLEVSEIFKSAIQLHLEA